MNSKEIVDWMNGHNEVDNFFIWTIESLKSTLFHAKKNVEFSTGGFCFKKTSENRVHISIDPRGKYIKLDKL